MIAITDRVRLDPHLALLQVDGKTAVLKAQFSDLAVDELEAVVEFVACNLDHLPIYHRVFFS